MTVYKTVTDTEIAKAIAHAEKLLNTAIEIVGNAHAHIALDQTWARNPKVVAVAILCRSISNFRASVLLVQQEQVLEARVLVRLMYENLLWLAALRERGAAFVHDMIEDEAFNRKALAEMTLKISATHGADIDGSGALQLRSIIKDLRQQFPNTKRLHADKTAAIGLVGIAYVEYSTFSLDAVHCSVTALGRHLSSERTDRKSELEVSVIPRIPSGEVLSTVLHACRALMGAAVAANELLEFTAETGNLAALMTEFEANGWQNWESTT
jgi:Family of unknown function (DUF5677)